MTQTESGGRLIHSCSVRAEPCPGGLRLECSVSADQTMGRMGVTCIRVQNRFGADVETIWNTDALRGGMTGHQCARHIVSEMICLPPGAYTAVVTFYAKNSLGLDAVTCRTAPVIVE